MILLVSYDTRWQALLANEIEIAMLAGGDTSPTDPTLIGAGDAVAIKRTLSDGSAG